MNRKLTISTLLYSLTLLPLSTWAKSLDLTPKNAINAQMVVQGYEWGPAVPKVIVEFEDNVTGFSKDTFSIRTANSKRQIIDAYNSDENGNRQENATNFVAFDLKVGRNASPFAYTGGKNVWTNNYELQLGLNSGTFLIGDYEYGNGNAWRTYRKNLADNFVVPDTDVFEKDSFKLENGRYTLQRAYFTPEGAEEDGVKNPLIIWLHGAGEGGIDVDIALLGNEVVALAKEGIQKYFTTEEQKGAYVLAVQTPTYWMEGNNQRTATSNQPSVYDETLFAAIQDYVNSHPDIDTNRIYVGGCSNGGYMTMNMMFEHGDYFAAYYPVCEAYYDRNISDEMITRVKDYNIWFLHSEDDTTVDPLGTSIPSYYRLLHAGAENVHYTLTDKVRGTDDPTAVYMGHFSWIYAFNDQVKKEFDNEKVVEDYDNVTIRSGKVTSRNNYVTNKNCNKDGNMWAWMAEQSKVKTPEDSCPGLRLDYPCCEGCDVYETDEDGPWGIENDAVSTE